jgi:hypothetical protein
MAANDGVKVMFNAILAKINDENTRMANLEDKISDINTKVASLSTKVSSVKADQGHLHVVINIMQSQIIPEGNVVGGNMKVPLHTVRVSLKEDKVVLSSTATPPQPPCNRTVLLNTQVPVPQVQ